MRHRIFMLLLVMFTVGLFCNQSQADMVYLYQKGVNRQVALANDNGELIRLLTAENLQAYHPEISADGRYVAYSIGTIQPGKVKVAIHVLDLETDAVEVWTPAGDQYIHAEFSGDGDYLAYSGPVEKENGQVRQHIHLIHLPEARAQGPVRTDEEDGRTVAYYSPEAEIIESDHPMYFPALASDASFVIYHRSRDLGGDDTAKELVRYDRIDRAKTVLTAEGGHAVAPSLSWDNRYLAYAGLRDGQWDIYLIDLWSEEDRQITRSPTKEFTPVFAPDGSITYTHMVEGDQIQMDLYRIAREPVLNPQAAIEPEPFIADPDVLEYIPAFSGTTEFRLQQRPSLPDPPRSSFGAVAHKGKIYVAGGHQGPEHTYPPESFLDRLDIYHTRTQTWTQGSPLSIPRQGFEMVAHGDYLYAFGGFAYSPDHDPPWRSLALIERYDIAKNRWEVLPAKLPRRRSSNIAAKIGNRVYLIGGWDSTPGHAGDKSGQFHPNIDIFDLKTLQVSDSAHELPDPLRRAFTAVVYQGEILLLGGISEGVSHFDWLDNVTAFDPRAGGFRKMAPLPFATFAPGAGVYRGKLFLFGGMNPKGRYQNTIYTLDLSDSRLWRNSGRYLEESKGFPIVVHHPDGGLGILGGHSRRLIQGEPVDSPVATFEHLQAFEPKRGRLGSR